MKLYHFPPSPNSRRVLAVAYHLGLDPELIDVWLPKGEQMKPEGDALKQGTVYISRSYKLKIIPDNRHD